MWSNWQRVFTDTFLGQPGSPCSILPYTGIVLGVGKTKISLILLLCVNLLNVLFNYLLIFGIGPFPAMGVAGAALGTVIARGIGSLAGIWIVMTPCFPGPGNTAHRPGVGSAAVA